MTKLEAVREAAERARWPVWYRGYEIHPTDAPGPLPASCAWTFVHESYDGAPDSGDNRCGHAATLADAQAEIDERIAEGEG